MRFSLVLLYVAATLSVAGCRRNEPLPPPQQGAGGGTVTTTAEPQNLKDAKINAVIALDNSGAVSKVRVGSKTDNDGLVSEEKLAFGKNEPILISMWLNESPNGLQTTARLSDTKGKLITEQRQAMNGAKTVTFRFTDKLKPGNYKLQGLWGGNSAGEFTVMVK